MNKYWESYVRSHNLVNRIYDMMMELQLLKKEDTNDIDVKRILCQRLEDVDYVESLAKCFERRMKNYQSNRKMFIKLRDLVYELEYLKQFLY